MCEISVFFVCLFFVIFFSDSVSDISFVCVCGGGGGVGRGACVRGMCACGCAGVMLWLLS